MPNRIIKESICTSDTVDQLSWFEECFFSRLIVNCDDFGRFDARIPILKARLFPLKTLRDKEISDALDSLLRAGIVEVYEYDGRPYLHLLTWMSHQQVRNQKSKYPAPEDGAKLKSIDINCNQEMAIAPVIQSNPNPKQNTKKTLCKADALALFERLWALYPEKKGKAKISDAKKVELYRIGGAEIERAIERYLTGLKEEDWRKPQNGSTFFNSGYVDYLDKNYSPSEVKPRAKKNAFHNFKERETDYNALVLNQVNDWMNEEEPS